MIYVNYYRWVNVDIVCYLELLLLLSLSLSLNDSINQPCTMQGMFSQGEVYNRRDSWTMSAMLRHRNRDQSNKHDLISSDGGCKVTRSPSTAQ